MNLNLRTTFSSAALFLAIGLGTSLQAVVLNPGDTSNLSNVGSLPSGYSVVATDLSLAQSFSILQSNNPDLSKQADTVSGLVGVKVLSGVTSNPFSGGLTFVYEIKNTSLLGLSEGIINFRVGGWAGFNIDVSFGGATDGSDLFFQPSNSPLVNPDTASRSSDGDILDVAFPPDPNAPPIFSGENSFQLFVFTNATAWTDTTGVVTTADFTETGHQIRHSTNNGDVATITAASTPDGGLTAILLGFGLVLLGLFAPHAKLAKIQVTKR